MPSMIHERVSPACSIFRSPAHNGRPIAITAGGYSSNTAEVLDYTVSGKSWELSKLTSAINSSVISVITSSNTERDAIMTPPLSFQGIAHFLCAYYMLIWTPESHFLLEDIPICGNVIVNDLICKYNQIKPIVCLSLK